MGVMVRVKPAEQERLDAIAQRVNEIRVGKKLKPVMDTTILHELIEMAMDEVEVNADGNLYYRKLENSLLKAIFSLIPIATQSTRYISTRTTYTGNDYILA